MDEERTIRAFPGTQDAYHCRYAKAASDMARDSSRSLEHSILLDRFRGQRKYHSYSIRQAERSSEFTFFGKSYSLLDNSPAVEFVEELKPYPNNVS